MQLDFQDISEIAKAYEKELLNNVIPFWQNHSYDRKYGGCYSYIDRAGHKLTTDKGGWVQGRALWLFSYLYEHFQQNIVWLEIAESCARFIWETMRQNDNRIPFLVTQRGDCLVMRRYLYSEMFAITGFAQLSRLAGMEKWLKPARTLLKLIHCKEHSMPVKMNPSVRSCIGHSSCMMMIHVYQILRDADPANTAEYNSYIDQRIETLISKFYKEEFGTIVETVAANGSLLDGPEGLVINPGHVIETAWFLLVESGKRKNISLQNIALKLIDASLKWGWDEQYGGLFSFRNAKGQQALQVEWDMKYWWPHCEAIYACLLAYKICGEQKYWDWFCKLHNYTWAYFPDREHGEWFGYLHRDGSLSIDFKGNHWKGPYHLPRMLAFVAKLSSL